MPATLHDVARAAGVSHTTVSWALRDDPRISPATRDRVRQAAADLGYSPNQVARSLARGRTETIAIVSTVFSSAFESETLAGIEAEMAACHPEYSLVQYSTGGRPERSDRIHRQLLQGNRADAVICLCDPPSAALRSEWFAAGKPLVVFDEDIADCASIRGDSRAGTRLATGLLLDSGCRRPGIVISRTDAEGRPACNPGRAAVFAELCAARGLAGAALSLERFSFEAGRQLAAAIAAAGWDGVFCAAGDMVAIGIMAGCRDLGLAIPADLRLVGYDNLMVGAMVQPALTTIAQPLEEMGREAVRSCFSLLAGFPARDGLPHKTFRPDLVCRQSV
jgi:DNA-binding LacI/PurR family transcriptional regulator